MINDNKDPKVIVEEKGLIQESNVGELEKIIEKNPFLDKESYLILTLVNKITFLYIFH